MLFPGDVQQTIQRRKDFSGNQTGYCDGYARSQSLARTVQIDQPDTGYAYCLFNELGDCRNISPLQSEIVSTDAAVNRSKREGVGEYDKQITASYIMQKSRRDISSISLDQKSNHTGCTYR